MKREGPSVHRRDPELVCTGCKHLKEKLITSSRSHARWESFCMHPKAKQTAVSETTGQLHAIIFDAPLCPTWCPLWDHSKDRDYRVCDTCGEVSPGGSVRCRNPILKNTLTGLKDLETAQWQCPKCEAWNP